MGFQEEAIAKIEKYLETKDYEKAMDIIKEELSMPYVEKNFEDKLIEYQLKIKQETLGEPITQLMSEQELREMLFSGEEDQLIAVSNLEFMNLRNLLPLIDEYLTSDKAETLVRGLLIDQLKKQEIGTTLHCLIDGQVISFIPKELPELVTDKITQEAFAKFDDWFGAKEPSILELLRNVFLEEEFRNLPLVIKEEELLDYCLSVTEYVMKAYDREKDFKDWLKANHFSSQYQLKRLRIKV